MNRFFVFLLFAMSFVVFREPAPFDLLACLWMALFLRVRRPRGRDPLFFAATVSMWVFVLCNALSHVLSEDMAPSTLYMAINLYLIALWWVIGAGGLDSSELRRDAVRGWVVAGVLSTALAIAAYLGVIPRGPPFLKFGRACGLFKDPNVFGPFLIPPLLFLVGDVVDGQRSWMRSFLPGCILLGGIFISFSRAAWGNALLALAVMAFYLVQWRRLARSMVLLLTLAGLSGGVLVVALQSEGIAALAMSRLAIKKYDSERFGAWEDSLEVVQEEPLGVGPGQAPVHVGMQPHNVFLKVWVEYGGVGLLAFLMALFFSLLRAWKNLAVPRGRGERVAALAGLLGVVANGVFVDTLHWRHLFVMAAWPFAISLDDEPDSGGLPDSGADEEGEPSS